VRYTSIFAALALLALVSGCMPNYEKQAASQEELLAKDGITALKPGDTAPAFSATAADGTAVEPLALGKPVVLFFFPVIETPNTTAELLALSRNTAKLAESGVAVYGVGPAQATELAAYAGKYELQLPLLADPQLTVARLYGCAAEGTQIPQRALVGVTPEGKVAFYIRLHHWMANPVNTILQGFGIAAPAKGAAK
jgi:thioredoxin-dependent peroxiredoxin